MKKSTNALVSVMMAAMLISTTVDARPGFRGGGVMNVHPSGGGAHIGGGGFNGGGGHMNAGGGERLGGGGSGERFAGGGDHPPPHPNPQPSPHPNPPPGPGPHPYPHPPGPGPHPYPPPPGPGPHPYPPPPPPHDGGDWYYDHPVATAAAVTTGVVLTAAAIGSIVYSIPNNCVPVYINNITYQQCGSTWYQPRYSGTTVQYIVINPPR